MNVRAFSRRRFLPGRNCTDIYIYTFIEKILFSENNASTICDRINLKKKNKTLRNSPFVCRFFIQNIIVLYTIGHSTHYIYMYMHNMKYSFQNTTTSFDSWNIFIYGASSIRGRLLFVIILRVSCKILFYILSRLSTRNDRCMVRKFIEKYECGIAEKIYIYK